MRASSQKNATSNYVKLFPKAMALERAFARAGGMLVAGTDPTGAGGVIPGLLQSASGRVAGRCGIHAARGDPHQHAERRRVSRSREEHRKLLPRANRPTWSSSTATPRRPSLTFARSRSCFVRASGYDPAKLIASVAGTSRVVLVGGTGERTESKSSTRPAQLVGPIEMPRVEKTDAEWRAQLTREQFQVARGKGHRAALLRHAARQQEAGRLHLHLLRLPLFTSDSKFNSGTGWPSFFQPIADENVVDEEDQTYGMRRVEILCARCDCHLGHVFDDGPRPTGLRYCVNSESLDVYRQRGSRLTRGTRSLRLRLALQVE